MTTSERALLSKHLEPVDNFMTDMRDLAHAGNGGSVVINAESFRENFRLAYMSLLAAQDIIRKAPPEEDCSEHGQRLTASI